MKPKVFFTLHNGLKLIDSYYLPDTRASLKKVKRTYANALNWLPDTVDKTAIRLEIREEGNLIASYNFTGKYWREGR